MDLGLGPWVTSVLDIPICCSHDVGRLAIAVIQATY